MNIIMLEGSGLGLSLRTGFFGSTYTTVRANLKGTVSRDILFHILRSSTKSGIFIQLLVVFLYINLLRLP
jgi:hypothetical protein